MKIALGTDHAGYEYKEAIKQYLSEHGHEVEDFGTHSPEPCDYPDFIYPAAQAVAHGHCERAIVLGGSGNGETIVANKVRSVRCAVCFNEELARLSRAHNDANAMAIGARTVSLELALKMVEIWLATPFDGGRHAHRVQTITELENRKGE
jgi:ribose 5-phosphate isomerase B